MAFSAEEEAQLRALLNSGKTIKAMHEDDPTAADTTGAEFYFATLKDDGVALSNAGAKSQQAADILATKGVIAENFVTLDETVVRADDHDLRLASIESQFPLPDPDPDPAPTPVFVATIDDNKLFANILIINSTGTHIAITSDDLSIPQTPLLNPGAWEEGIPSSYNMVDWTAKDLRCYQWDVDAGVTQILDQDGEEFITVTPRDTLAPEPITDLVLSAGTDTSTQFKYLFSSTTDNSGAVEGYRLKTIDADTVFINPAIPDVTTEISGRTPGETISLWVEAYDASGNATHPENDGTNTTSITLTTTIPGDVGEASFTADNYEDDESTHTSTAVLQRTSGTSGNFQVTLSTKDRLNAEGAPLIPGGVGHEFGTTAQVSTGNNTVDLSASSPGWSDGQLITYSHDLGSDLIGLTNATSYYVFDTGTDVYSFHTVYADSLTGASPVNLTASGAETHLILEGENVGYESLSSVVYSWADGVGPGADHNVVVRLVDRGNLGNNYNNVFQLEIDDGSNTDGASNPVGAIGTVSAALMLVNSSSTGFVGFNQDGVGTIAWEAEDSNSTIVADADSAARIWGAISRDRASSGSAMQPANSGVTRGTATTIEPNASYVQYPLSITLSGANDYDLFARMIRVSSSETRAVHFTLERPIASIGADDSGGGGQFRVTMTEDHGYLAGDTIELEGTDAHDGTYTITDVPATKTWDAANVAIAAQGTAAGVALLTAGTGGDSGILGLYTLSWSDSSACQSTRGSFMWQWTNWDSGCNDRTFTIPAPGAWVLRMYQYSPQPMIDRICIAETGVALDPANTGDPPIYSLDDDMGPDLSTYSIASTVGDNPENPTDTEIPIPPVGTETAVTLEPPNGSVDRALSSIIFAEFDTDVTNIIIQTMTVSTGGNAISGTPVVKDSGLLNTGPVVVFERDVSTLTDGSTYTITGTGTCEVAGVLKSISFGTWSFATIDTVNDPDIIYARDFNSQPLDVRRRLTNSEISNLLGNNYYWGQNYYLSPDPSGSRGMVLEQYIAPNTIGAVSDIRYPEYTGVTSIYFSMDAYVKTPWDIVNSNPRCKFESIVGNFPRGVSLRTPGKCNATIVIRPYSGVHAIDMYYYDETAEARGFGRNQFWCDVPTRTPVNLSEAVPLPKDRWFNIKVQATMNTSTSAADGILRGWLDGVLKFERTNLRWTNVEATRAWDNHYMFSNGADSGSPNYGQSHFYDNFILSSTPI